MEKAYNPLLHKLVHGTDDERKLICEKRIDLFALVYFSEYFKYKIPNFHIDFYKDLEDLENGEINESIWVAFRESAKTSLAKIFLTHAICYQKKRYILAGSYDKKNAESILFDVVFSLQTNPKLLHDFGSLYTEKRGDDEVKMKRVASFITASGIKVESISTQESTRGRLYQSFRPDLLLYDDIENSKTRLSVPLTRKIIAHLDEAKAGLSPEGVILYLGNYLSESGVIAHLMSSISRNDRGVVRNVPVIIKGKTVWPDKYALTDEEALETGKISLQTRRRELGDISWRENMMNDPAGAAEPFFDRRKIDLAIANAPDPIEDLAGFHVFARYNPSHRYAIGADTSMGLGLDSNAAATIDFSSVPNLLVGTYANNQIPPDVFAHELKREGNMYGTCLVAPESNGESGGACVNTLKNIYKNVYQTRQSGKIYDKATQRVGWRTTGASKPEMLFKLKKDYEDGTLEIRDVRLLREMRSYTAIDAVQEVSPLEATRHFDLLMAACIANMMREHATYTPVKRAFKQPEYETPSLESQPRKVIPTRRGYQQPSYESPGL